MISNNKQGQNINIDNNDNINNNNKNINININNNNNKINNTTNSSLKSCKLDFINNN